MQTSTLTDKTLLCTTVDLVPTGVVGAQAERFLQGQLTCNMAEVLPTDSRLAAHCTPKGRVIALVRVIAHHRGYVLLTPSNMQPLLINALQKYAMFSKITLADWSADLQIIGYSPATTGQQFLLPEVQDIMWIALPGERMRFLAVGTPSACQQLSAVVAATSVTVDTNTWKCFDIHAGLPQVYSATSELFLPHALNLPALNAVSFNKGCYTGQEIIARTHYLGKQKQQLYSAWVKQGPLPQPGESLSSDIAGTHLVGYVVDAAMTSDAGYEMLVVLKHAALEHPTIYCKGNNVLRLT